MEVRLVQSLCKRFFSYLIRLPSVATFNFPSLVGQAVPACHHNVRRGRLTYHRGWGCVTTNLHTPLSPLLEGNHTCPRLRSWKSLKFLNIQLLTPISPFARGELREGDWAEAILGQGSYFIDDSLFGLWSEGCVLRVV